MIKSFIEIFGSDISSIQRNFVKATIVTSPLSYVVLDMFSSDFRYLDFAPQCVYAIALSILTTSLNVIFSAILVRQHSILRNVTLYFTLCPFISVFSVILLCQQLFPTDNIVSVFSRFVMFDSLFIVILFLQSFPFVKYYREKKRKKNEVEPTHSGDEEKN